MPKRWMIVVGVLVAVVVSAVTVAVVVAGRPRPACGCSVVPDVRGPARGAAVRFEALVQRADVAGAWALLTDAARTRYVDVAGFQPAFDRLRKGLGEAGDWLVVDERARSQVVVLRYTSGPPRLVWPLLVQVQVGHAGDERIDPEPPALRLTAVGDGDRVRVEVPDGDLALTRFVVIDAAGRDWLPGREHVSDGVDRLAWSIPSRGPVVAVAIEQRGTGVRIGSAPVG